MRWPFGSRADPEPATVSPEPGPPNVDEVHSSPGLRSAVAHLDTGVGCNILDLGPSMAATVRFFSRYRCRMRIVDLCAVVTGDPKRQARLAGDPRAVINELLSGPPGAFDLVLAWDVFDRLDRRPAEAVVQRLAFLSRPGARLFTLFSTTRGQPTLPLAFAVLDEETLLYRRQAGPPSHRPAFNPAGFERLLAGFSTEVSVVLRHGVQEWVAIRADTRGI